MTLLRELERRGYVREIKDPFRSGDEKLFQLTKKGAKAAGLELFEF